MQTLSNKSGQMKNTCHKTWIYFAKAGTKTQLCVIKYNLIKTLNTNENNKGLSSRILKTKDNIQINEQKRLFHINNSEQENNYLLVNVKEGSYSEVINKPLLKQL